MGANSSTLEGSTLGYHVLECIGPAKQAGLEEYFDFVTHINNVRIDPTTNFQSTIQQFINRPLGLIVYSSKTTKLRNVSVVPTEQGLGIKCKLCDFDRIHERIWHVQPHSPAFDAGLRPNTDYILGSTKPLKSNQDFITLISESQNQPVKLYVFNLDLDAIREVTIIPNSQWGGEGSLGCDIGYGNLHRIALAIPEEPAIKFEMKSTTFQTDSPRAHNHSHDHQGCTEHGDGHSHDHRGDAGHSHRDIKHTTHSNDHQEHATDHSHEHQEKEPLLDHQNNHTDHIHSDSCTHDHSNSESQKQVEDQNAVLEKPKVTFKVPLGGGEDRVGEGHDHPPHKPGGGDSGHHH